MSNSMLTSHTVSDGSVSRAVNMLAVELWVDLAAGILSRRLEMRVALVAIQALSWVFCTGAHLDLELSFSKDHCDIQIRSHHQLNTGPRSTMLFPKFLVRSNVFL